MKSGQTIKPQDPPTMTHILQWHSTLKVLLDHSLFLKTVVTLKKTNIPIWRNQAMPIAWERMEETVIEAEMVDYLTKSGQRSPFWDSVYKYLIKMNNLQQVW